VAAKWVSAPGQTGRGRFRIGSQRHPSAPRARRDGSHLLGTERHRWELKLERPIDLHLSCDIIRDTRTVRATGLDCTIPDIELDLRMLSARLAQGALTLERTQAIAELAERLDPIVQSLTRDPNRSVCALHVLQWGLRTGSGSCTRRVQ
jgi:hypothetical protein